MNQNQNKALPEDEGKNVKIKLYFSCDLKKKKCHSPLKTVFNKWMPEGKICILYYLYRAYILPCVFQLFIRIPYILQP